MTFSALKAGDRVAVMRSGSTPSIATVERVTATLIVAGNERYRKDDGESYPAVKWNRKYIERLTHELEQKVVDMNYRSDFKYKMASYSRWLLLNTEEMKQIEAILEVSRERARQNNPTTKPAIRRANKTVW